jgi:hypothetical protein
MSLLTKETIEGLNKNPYTLLNGLEAAAEEKNRQFAEAKANNDERLQEKLNAEINEIDERIVEIKTELGDERYMEDRRGNFKGGYQMKRKMYANGSLLEDDMAMMQEEEEMPTHTMPDGTVMPGATHEEGEMMMEESEKPEMEMESDSEMEDNYLDFIINEALSEEEEDMLMSKLEQDEELSMLFDKVIEVASEFAGSGPVEGPGTGVSDSIPARLSDGEFVFTAKAVEEIGADNLMAMMKDAEMKADERQGMANGGTMEEEDQPEPVVVAEQAPVRQDIRVTKQTVGPQASVQEERDLIDEEIKKGMLSSRPYVRS